MLSYMVTKVKNTALRASSSMVSTLVAPIRLMHVVDLTRTTQSCFMATAALVIVTVLPMAAILHQAVQPFATVLCNAWNSKPGYLFADCGQG